MTAPLRLPCPTCSGTRTTTHEDRHAGTRMGKDRPTLFSGSMVRALLAGRKTQTRRILKPQPYPFVTNGQSYWNATGRVGGRISISDAELLRLHRWVVGDRLWVREAVRAEDCDETWDHLIRYLADDTTAKVADHSDDNSDAFGRWWLLNGYRSDDPDLTGGKPVSSIHMPRWASRLTLEVTEVRVERLQDISEADAVAEGIAPYHGSGAYLTPKFRDGKMRPGPSAYHLFRQLWDDVHGPDAWAANPWVAAISFRVHRANIDTLPNAPTSAEPAPARDGVGR